MIYVTFKIKYKLNDASEYLSCELSYGQYVDFKNLPTMEDCYVVREDVENFEQFKKEMQMHLKSVVKKDKSHTKKLSENL